MQSKISLIVLGIVFAASVLNQLPIHKWQVFVARIDPWTFLPFWGFFGPKPAHAGLHIVYRDRCNGHWSEWTEISIPQANAWRWLWNPARHERKAFHDLLNGFAKIIEEIKDPDKVILSSCHLALLGWVVAQRRIDKTATRRQFAIVETIGHKPTREVRAAYISREFYLG